MVLILRRRIFGHDRITISITNIAAVLALTLTDLGRSYSWSFKVLVQD